MSISKKNLNLSILQKNRQNFKFCKYSPICPSLTSCRLENCCRHFLFSGEQLIHNINNIVLLNLKNCRMPPPSPLPCFFNATNQREGFFILSMPTYSSHKGMAKSLPQTQII